MCARAEDAALLERMEVLANDRICEGVGIVTLAAPRIAASVRPGQFVHLKVGSGTSVLLRRPFSVHRASGDAIEILYQVLGRGTRELSLRGAGDALDAIGPLGNGWTMPDGLTHALLVAGGLGAAPMGMLAERLSQRGVAVSFAQGAPNVSRLVARGLFESVSRRYECSTDDGSEGSRGLVTEVSARLLEAHPPDIVYACGPEAMQRAVASQALAAGVPCQVSLERLMACGVGACLSCVVGTVRGPERACFEGPVFDAADVLWDPSEIPPGH